MSKGRSGLLERFLGIIGETPYSNSKKGACDSHANNMGFNLPELLEKQYGVMTAAKMEMRLGYTSRAKVFVASEVGELTKCISNYTPLKQYRRVKEAAQLCAVVGLSEELKECKDYMRALKPLAMSELLRGYKDKITEFGSKYIGVQ